MNIILIGYRGTGKTTIAKELGKRLGMDVIGMDDEIVKREGLSIPQIVEKKGWEGFRDIESKVVLEISKKDNKIIDTGGGVIIREKNIDNLKKNGVVFWLQADIETIVERIKDGTQRPSLTRNKSFIDEVGEVLAERNPQYSKSADYVIDTSGRKVKEITDEIISKFKGKLETI